MGAFRETMLVFFADEVIERILRPFGNLLYDLSLETHAFGDEGPDFLGKELRAAAKELRHLEAFLTAAGQSPAERDDDPRKWELTRLARRMAKEVGGTAITIERALAVLPMAQD